VRTIHSTSVFAGSLHATVVKKFLDRAVNVILLLSARGQPSNECSGVIDISASWHEVRVRPEGIARFCTDGIRYRFPHGCSFAQPARAKLESNKSRECGFGRPTGRSASTNRFGDRST